MRYVFEKEKLICRGHRLLPGLTWLPLLVYRSGREEEQTWFRGAVWVGGDWLPMRRWSQAVETKEQILYQENQ